LSAAKLPRPARSARTDKEYLVRGSLINGLGLLSRVVSPFLVILLARYYPPKDFGLFVSIQALVLTLSRIAILGLDKGLVWYAPKILRSMNAGSPQRLGLSDSLYVAFIMGAFIWVGFAIAGFTGLVAHFEILGQGSTAFILVMIAAVLPFTGIQVASGALDGIRLPQYRTVIALFLGTALVPALAFATRPWLGDRMSLAAGMLLGNLAAFLCFLPVLRAKFPNEPWLRPASPAPELWRYSLPLAGAELASNILMRIDLWMILLLLGPQKAAVYAVMVTITNGLRTVRQTFEPLLIPIVSNFTGEECKVKLKATFSYATNLVSTIQLFIACFIFVFPREILSLAGKDYVMEIFAFALLMMGNLANGFLGLNGGVLLGLGKSRVIFLVIVSGLGLNLLGNWLLIPRLGVTGAALMSCLVLLYQNSIHYFYVRKVLGLQLYESHLYLNAILEISVIGTFFFFYKSIETLPLQPRMVIFGVMVLIFGSLTFFKRKTFLLK
jgi:O-antigen/teichoic acid export membrane protein